MAAMYQYGQRKKQYADLERPECGNNPYFYVNRARTSIGMENQSSDQLRPSISGKGVVPAPESKIAEAPRSSHFNITSQGGMLSPYD